MKYLVILGGPNGAGKTTAAQIVVPRKLGIAEFVNADEIARGLSPFNPNAAAFAAGRLTLARMRNLAAGERSFAIETTCAGRGHLRFVRACKDAGWSVLLIFLWLPSPDAALERVAARVAAGGHAIPPHDVIRRYRAGLRNMLVHYLPMADIAAIYDNSAGGRILIAERLDGAELLIRDPPRWRSIERYRDDDADAESHA